MRCDDCQTEPLTPGHYCECCGRKLSLQERRTLDAMGSVPSVPVVESVVDAAPVLDHVAAVQPVQPVPAAQPVQVEQHERDSVHSDTHPVHVDEMPHEDESARAARCHSCGAAADDGELCSSCRQAFHSLLENNTLPAPALDTHAAFADSVMPSAIALPSTAALPSLFDELPVEKTAEPDPIAIAAAALDALSIAHESKPVAPESKPSQPSQPDTPVVSETAVAVFSAPTLDKLVDVEPVVAAVATTTVPTPAPVKVQTPEPKHEPKPAPVLAAPKVPAPAARLEPAVVAPAASGSRSRSVVMWGAAVLIIAAIGVPLSKLWLGRQEVLIVPAPVARPQAPKPQAKVNTPPKPVAPPPAVVSPSPSTVAPSAPVIVPPAPAAVAPKTAALSPKPVLPAPKATTSTMPVMPPPVVHPTSQAPAPVAAAPVASVASLPVAAPPPSAEIVVPPSVPTPAPAPAPAPAPTPAPAAAAPAPAAPATPTAPFYEPADVTDAPKATTRVSPQIPAELKGTGLNEVVIARVLVSHTGHPALVGLLRHSKAGPALDEAVLAAVKQWRFAPARKRGEAVSCWLNVAVTVKGE